MLLAKLSNAQTVVKGIITESDDEPISFVLIDLKNAASNDIIKTIATDSAGYYQINIDNASDAVLRIKALGFRDTTLFLNSNQDDTLVIRRVKRKDNYLKK